MIKTGNIYTYKELCEEFNEKCVTGNSKIAQLNNWKIKFEWVNPTKQKYLITEIFSEERQRVYKNRGGYRENSGNKKKVQEEFDVIINAFIKNKRRKNHNVIYFTRDEIFRFFNLYRNIYALENDKELKHLFDCFYEKVGEIGRSWILNKIKNNPDYELSYTIEATLEDNKVEYVDELLEDWERHQKDYLIIQQCVALQDIIRLGKWEEMMAYIDSFFDRYKTTKKVYKLIFKEVKETTDNVQMMKYSLNQKCIESLLGYFDKKREISLYEDLAFEYELVIDKYIAVEEEVYDSVLMYNDEVIDSSYLTNIIFDVTDLAVITKDNYKEIAKQYYNPLIKSKKYKEGISVLEKALEDYALGNYEDEFNLISYICESARYLRRNAKCQRKYVEK